MILSLLTDVDCPDAPLSDQLKRAASQLSAMRCAGELDELPEDTRTTVSALALFLLGAADRARDLEYPARPARSRRPIPLSETVALIVGRMRSNS